MVHNITAHNIDIVRVHEGAPWLRSFADPSPTLAAVPARTRARVQGARHVVLQLLHSAHTQVARLVGGAGLVPRPDARVHVESEELATVTVVARLRDRVSDHLR